MPYLFYPKREPNYSLNAIVHFFSKRLRIMPTETLEMEESKRDAIFAAEMDILEKEIAESKKK